MAGRPRYTVDQVRAAIVAARGFLAVAAKILRCDRSTVYAYVQKHPTLAKTIAEQRDIMVDMAELRLLKAVEAGQSWAISMVLRTVGRNRGYVERQEIDHIGGSDQNVHIYLPAKDE